MNIREAIVTMDSYLSLARHRSSIFAPDEAQEIDAALSLVRKLKWDEADESRRFVRALDGLVQACTAVVSSEEFAVALAEARDVLRELDAAEP